MAYYRPSIDAAGIHVPTYDDIMEYLTEQYKEVFGADVYLGIDSKDYQMLSIFAKVLDDYAALAVDAYNARSPLYATGDSLDVLCTVVGISRRPSEYAEAVVKLTGTTGTVVTAGKKVSDINGGLWTLIENCTIAAGGTNTTVRKDDPGKVELQEGDISLVYTVEPGWDGVTNITTGTLGRDTETDQELRTRMRIKMLSKAETIDIAIESGLSSIVGVTNVSLCINDDNASDPRGIPIHTICAVVEGGEANDIAQVLYDNKAPGIGTYGSSTGTAYDAYGEAKTINFARPTLVPFAPIIKGTVYNENVDLASLKAQVQQIVYDWGNSLGIGETVTMTKVYADIYSAIQASGVAITRIYVLDESYNQLSVLEPEWNERYMISALSDVDVSGIEVAS